MCCSLFQCSTKLSGLDCELTCRDGVVRCHVARSGWQLSELMSGFYKRGHGGGPGGRVETERLFAPYAHIACTILQ